MLSVGTFEMKTHLSQFLDQVEHGAEIVITRHGQPIALLLPAKPVSKREKIQSLVAEIKASRKGRKLGKGISIKDLIEDGRKY